MFLFYAHRRRKKYATKATRVQCASKEKMNLLYSIKGEVISINTIVKTNDLSFYNEFGILTLNAKQFDTGRKFIFNIMENDEAFDIRDCKTYIRIQKADGTQFQGNACCKIEDINSIVVDTSIGNGNQILAAPGVNQCELHLEDNNGICLTTWTFNIYVEKRVHNAENLSSYNSFDVIDNMIVMEKDRIENEKIRKQNEERRIISENKRIDNEAQRQKNEDIRKNNEGDRNNNENQRIDNENLRKQAEQIRDDNENTRILHEDQRIDNESQREAEEKIRQDNENDRKKTFNTVLSQAQTYATSASVSAYNAKESEKKTNINAATASICAYNSKESEKNCKISENESKKSELSSSIFASASATSASISAYSAKEAQSWAQGYTGIRQDENTNNSKFWCQQSQLHKNAAEILLNDTTELLQGITQQIIDFEFEVTDDGELIYESDTYDFEINDDGELEYWIQQEEEI